jgi:8-oxo-dGTP diphosphatase
VFDEPYPLKRVGTGLLVRDLNHARVLLVQPTYKSTWEIPGGLVEHNESPRQGVVREGREELGVDFNVGRLLVVQHNAVHDLATDDIMFVFDGGRLDPDKQFAMPNPNEILQHQYVAPSELFSYVSPSLLQRLTAALSADESGRTIYIEWPE